MELVLVMLVICAVLGMVAPSLRGFMRGRAASDAAARIVALCHYARNQAVVEARIYRLNIDPRENVYFLTMQEDGEFVELGKEFGREFTVPEKSTIELVRTSEENLDSIDFRPDGSSDSVTIRLTDPQGEETFIGSLSPTEMYRVLRPEEVQR